MNYKNYVDGLVSVITPVFKCEKYITSCVLSAINQTYDNVEVILVDDCSPDRSSIIIKDLQKAYLNIRYERLQQNSGAAIARNKALELANGRYVAFLDGDDAWLPDKLEKQLCLMKEKQAILVYGAIDMIGEDNNAIKPVRNTPKSIDYNGLLRNTAIATSTVIVDRYLAGDFRMPLIRSGQDYATWLMLLRRDKTAYAVTDLVTHYRKTEGSLSSKKTKNWKKVYNIQVNYEKISKVKAYYNCFCYICHAVNKYFL